MAWKYNWDVPAGVDKCYDLLGGKIDISNKKTRFSALNKFYIIRKNKTKFSNYDFNSQFLLQATILITRSGRRES